METRIAELEETVEELGDRLEAVETAAAMHVAQRMYLETVMRRLIRVVYRLDAELADEVMSQDLWSSLLAGEAFRISEDGTVEKMAHAWEQTLKAMIDFDWKHMLGAVRKEVGLNP